MCLFENGYHPGDSYEDPDPGSVEKPSLMSGPPINESPLTSLPTEFEIAQLRNAFDRLDRQIERFWPSSSRRPLRGVTRDSLVGQRREVLDRLEQLALNVSEIEQELAERRTPHVIPGPLVTTEDDISIPDLLGGTPAVGDARPPVKKRGRVATLMGPQGHRKSRNIRRVFGKMSRRKKVTLRCQT